MTLEELISECKRANSLATEGECEVTTLYESEFTLVNIGTEIVCTSVSRPTGEAIAIRHNTGLDVCLFLEAVQLLDRHGVLTTSNVSDAYGVMNHIRVLQRMGLNDNMSDPGAGEYADELAGHLQTAYDAGREAERARPKEDPTP